MILIDSVAMGFASTVPHGYGVNYYIGPNVIKMSMECKKSSGISNLITYEREVRLALLDMKRICDGHAT
jgi:hypothetical protein